MREVFNQRPVYSLSEVTNSIRTIISKTYNQSYYIKAEILKLNFYPHSGHCFPELVEKENGKIKSQMRAVIWATQYNLINERFISITGEPLKENINILCLASVEFSSQYGLSLFIQNVEPIYTLGEMEKNKQEVIKQLKKEGIFDSNKQKSLPLVPKRIAVISVETSKGYSDFVVALKQNNWNYQFDYKLFPSILQGEKAIISITHQLSVIAEKSEQFDCIVIVRGGGADVGMSCYDDYTLAKAIALAPLPVISGIGHSTNETISDMVAYSNKITPTEVAYFLIQQFHNFAIQVEENQAKLLRYSKNILRDEFFFFTQIETMFEHAFEKWSNTKRQDIDNQAQRLKIFLKQYIEKKETILIQAETKVELLRPENVLKRGYSITYSHGKSVTDLSQVNDKELVITKLYNGEFKSRIEK